VLELFGVLGHAGVRGNEVADELASGGSALEYLGPEPALGVSRRNIQTALSRWVNNQHCASWQNLGNTERQARELMSGPSRGAKVKLLPFNKTQSREVTGLLTGHHTLRRRLHLLGLQDSPLCRSCGVEEETSAHVLCNCEALASLRNAYLGSLFMEPNDILSINLGAIWGFLKATGLP
jgi:hypothetical protein